MAKKKAEITYLVRRIDEMDKRFHQMPDLAFTVLAGKPAAYMIYSYLVKNFNTKFNYAFPTIAQIMNDLGFGSNTTVITAIDYLEEKRLIRTKKRKQGSNKYDNNRYVVYYPVALNPLTKEENEMFPKEEIVTTTI
jgi:hypothetical protein